MQKRDISAVTYRRWSFTQRHEIRQDNDGWNPPAFMSVVEPCTQARAVRDGSILGAVKGFFMPVIQNLAKRGTSAAFGVAKDIANDAF